MIRKMLIALGVVLTLVLLNVGLAGARDTQSGTLLPGETIWSSGASSYIFGTNDSIEYWSPNVDTLPSVQADLKAGGLTLMRTWAYDVYSNADIEQRIATIENAGMTCMMMLGNTNDLALDGARGVHARVEVRDLRVRQRARWLQQRGGWTYPD